MYILPIWDLVFGQADVSILKGFFQLNFRLSYLECTESSFSCIPTTGFYILLAKIANDCHPPSLQINDILLQFYFQSYYYLYMTLLPSFIGR